VTRTHAFIIGFTVAVLGWTASSTHAQSKASLSRAKELYASANYDEALSMLNELGTIVIPEGGAVVGTPSEEAASVALYRVLCLVAVGRSAEVDLAIDRLVTQHPLYRPPSDELSPRVRTAVHSARLRVLPTLVQKRYEESRSHYDRGEFAAASAGFKWVLTALADPDLAYLAGQAPLADIKTLAGGFAGLAEKALAPPPPPPAPVVAAPAVMAAAPAPPAKPARDLTRVFTADDADVTAPVKIQQNMPRFPSALREPVSGVIDVVIDPTGKVESARIVDPVHLYYDGLLVTAAKRWQYQPATLDGIPVRFSKRIQVSLNPNVER
jgi:TonB family protein